MPANFTRRLDLFRDARFPSPEDAVLELARLSDLPLFNASESADELIRAIAAAKQQHPLSSALERLAARVPEWLFDRNGDLATVLWLTQDEHGTALGQDAPKLNLPGFVLSVVDAMFQSGRSKDAFCLLRFLVDVELDFSMIHREKGPAYGFFQERDPNPFVWKLLEYFEAQSSTETLSVLELGCGVGNDAVGLLSSHRVVSFMGIDVSPNALTRLSARTEHARTRVRSLAGDFAEILAEPVERGLGKTNLVYSYSSLHYFNSTQLSELLHNLRALLLPNHGWLAFAIKGAGSVWDGQGIPLYQPDVWINWDGQSRWFPSQKALARLLDQHGFAVKFHELHEHWGYSERGKRDIFHYVLCAPV